MHPSDFRPLGNRALKDLWPLCCGPRPQDFMFMYQYLLGFKICPMLHVQLYSMMKVCQEPKVILAGCWWFLTGYLEDRVSLAYDYIKFQLSSKIESVSQTPNSSWLYVTKYICAKFFISSMIRSVWRTALYHQWLKEHWWFLTGEMEDMEHSSYMIPNISAKFQLSSTIRSVSRTPPSSSVTWRTLRVPDQRHGGHGSSSTS